MGKAARLNRERLIANGVDFNQPYKTTFTVEEVLVECRRRYGIGALLINRPADRIAYLNIEDKYRTDPKLSGFMSYLEMMESTYLVLYMRKDGLGFAVDVPIDPKSRNKDLHRIFAKTQLFATPQKLSVADAVEYAIIFPQDIYYLKWAEFALSVIDSMPKDGHSYRVIAY